jgi:hypothetical protein
LKVHFDPTGERSANNPNLLNKHTAGTAVNPAIKITNIIVLLLLVKL